MGLFRRRARRYEAGELLFCRESLGIQMKDRISQLIGEEGESEGNTVTFRVRGMEISFAGFGTEDEGEAGIYAKRELEGIRKYFRQVQTEHTDIQRNLMFVLERCQGIVRVHYSFEQKNEKADQEKIAAAGRMIELVRRGMGTVMTKEGEAIAGSDGKVILDKTGDSQVKSFLPPVEDNSEEERKRGVSRESLERRKKSIMELRRRQIHVPAGTPVLEPEERTKARTRRQVCGRASALLTVALYSECLLGEKMKIHEAREFVREIIEHFRADEFFSPAEQAFLEDDCPDEAVRIQFSWQYESLYAIEWALGMFERLDWPEQFCDVGECVRKMREFDTFSQLERTVQLRSKKELLDGADFLYRLGWACADAEKNGFAAPGRVISQSVAQRRRALLWAAGCSHETTMQGELQTGSMEDKSEGWDIYL